MSASRIRLAFASLGVLAAGPAAAEALGGARACLAALLPSQTANVTVYAKMVGSGAVGVVQLAPAVDVDPPGPGPEDLPASAPTTPAVACQTGATANCVGAATLGSTVVLAPASVSNAAFVSWAGCSSVTPPTAGSPSRCNVIVTGAKTVTANFKPATYTLAVKTYPALTPGYTPPYGGRLQAPTTPPIDCQTGSPTWTACSAPVENGAAVTVTALPEPGSRVTAWSGCTSSAGSTCTLSPMSASRVVSATFGPGNVLVTGQVAGSGTLSAPAGGPVADGMSCPTDCTAAVASGGSITLTATPGEGYELLGWTGCSSATSTCTLANVTAPVTVAVTFRSASCTACHGLPPGPPHVPRTDCGSCHPGFTSRTVDPAVHMNQRTDPRHTDPASAVCTGEQADPSRCVECHPCQGE